MCDIGERGRADENKLSERVTAAAECSFDVRCQFSMIAERGRKVTRWRVVVSIKDTVMIAGTRRTSNVQIKSQINNQSFPQLYHTQILAVGLISCEDPILFDLVSYCDVRLQSNPFILKGDKRVLVERAW